MSKQATSCGGNVRQSLAEVHAEMAELRSHAIGQRAREMSDDVDPACRSELEAMESAAKPYRGPPMRAIKEPELLRLRRLAHLAAELVMARPDNREEIIEDMSEALWPEE